MWSGLDQYGRILFDASVSTTLFLSLVVLMMLVCRQPARRILIAEAGILSSLMMLPLVALAPFPRLDPLGYLLGDHPSNQRDIPDIKNPVSISPALPLPTSQGFALEPGIPRPSLVWALRGTAISHLVVTSLGMSWLFLGFWGVRRLVRDTKEPRRHILEVYRSVAAEVGSSTSCPELRVSARVGRPVLAGLFNARILIPEELDDPAADTEALRLTLLHELAHVQQGDTWFGTAATAAQIVWFFLPFVWWLRNQLRIDQEFLADQKASAFCGPSERYARRLVGLANPQETMTATSTRDGDLPLPPQSPWRMGDLSTPLVQRVAMLLHCPYPLEARPPRWWSWLIPALILSTAMALSCLRTPLFPPETRKESRAILTADPDRRFEVERFVATPHNMIATGRALPYVLPVLMPEEFELTAEIVTGHNSLSQTRIAGCPLALAAAPRIPGSSTATQPPADDPPLSHHLRIRRDLHGVKVMVNGKEVGIDFRGRLTEWLTVEPPRDQTLVVRDLIMTW